MTVYLKLSKAAKILDVHKDTIRRYIQRGFLSGHQLPTGHWRVRETSVLNLLNRTVEDEIGDLLASL